jgi:hypothetical protein
MPFAYLALAGKAFHSNKHSSGVCRQANRSCGFVIAINKRMFD